MRNKRADAALATKPTGRAVSQARRAALSGRGKAAAKAPQSIASLARQSNPTLSGRELAQQVRSQRSTTGGIGGSIGATRSSRPAGRVRPQPAAAADQPWKVGLSETSVGQFVTGTKVGRSSMTTGDEPGTCRTITGTEYMGADIFREFCQSELVAGVAKVRVSPTGHGNRITGNEVGRSNRVTGDEPGTCQHITGTEYLSPNQVEAFCDLTPAPGPRKVGVTRTGGGEQLSGTLVGRSGKVTGDEHGAGIRPTGTQYTNPSDTDVPLIERGKGGGEAGRTDNFAAFAGSRVAADARPPVAGAAASAPMPARASTATRTAAPSIRSDVRSASAPTSAPTARPGIGKVPPKVETTHTLAGGTITGTRVGRSERVTGDEPGSCRLVTGDEYLDLGHFQSFCGTEPAPEPSKVGQSRTLKGQEVSGTQAGRSSKVTGDEPGTCKVITGTPYAGLEQAEAFCDVPQRAAIAARTRPTSVMPMPRMTGIQPGVDRPRAEGGVVSGAHRGACEPVSGTPYIGADQYAAACGPIGGPSGGFGGAEDGGGNGALPGQPDFPQSLDGAPWQQFSVLSPAREAFAASAERASASERAGQGGGVTGTLYESNRHITGPFGMATGKITGTEQFRSDGRRATSVLTANDPPAGAPTATGDALPVVPSRVTGEGQSAGTKVTGDDWERGDRVTGTEGRSARRRNPTRPGPMGAMPVIERKRNEDLPAPVSLVTGSAGSSARGSLVTYSGGARG